MLHFVNEYMLTPTFVIMVHVVSCIDWGINLFLYVFLFYQFQWFMCEEVLRFFRAGADY